VKPVNKPVQITADSTCDLSPELLKMYNVETVPLYVQLGDKTYRDGMDIRTSLIFDTFSKEGILPKTSAVSEYDYNNLFTKFTEQDMDIVHVNIGAEFSSCYQNALIAGKSFDNVFVVDSRSVSIGTGLLAVLGAEMAKTGASAEEIFSFLQQAVPRVEISFIIDTLTYMSKGGRCSAVTALGAGLLHLKPCIEVKDGKMIVGKKYRGKLEHCLKAYVRDRLVGRDDIDLSRIFITHSVSDNSIVQNIKEEILSLLPFKEVYITDAGCTVSVSYTHLTLPTNREV